MKPIICLIGDSGSGKTTAAGIFESMGIPRCISSTTRKMRKGEMEGVDYFFKSGEEFVKQDLLESDVYCGMWYGLPLEEVHAKLENPFGCLAVVTPKGYKNIKARLDNKESIAVISVAVYAPNTRERLIQRNDGTDISERISANCKSNTCIKPDYILDNTGTLQDLKKDCERILNSIALKMGGVKHGY